MTKLSATAGSGGANGARRGLGRFRPVRGGSGLLPPESSGGAAPARPPGAAPKNTGPRGGGPASRRAEIRGRLADGLDRHPVQQPLVGGEVDLSRRVGRGRDGDRVPEQV